MTSFARSSGRQSSAQESANSNAAMMVRIAQLSDQHLLEDGHPDFDIVAATISKEACQQLTEAVAAGHWPPASQRLYPVAPDLVQKAWQVLWQTTDLGAVLGRVSHPTATVGAAAAAVPSAKAPTTRLRTSSAPVGLTMPLAAAATSSVHRSTNREVSPIAHKPGSFDAARSQSIRMTTRSSPICVETGVPPAPHKLPLAGRPRAFAASAALQPLKNSHKRNSSVVVAEGITISKIRTGVLAPLEAAEQAAKAVMSVIKLAAEKEAAEKAAAAAAAATTADIQLRAAEEAQRAAAASIHASLMAKEAQAATATTMQSVSPPQATAMPTQPSSEPHSITLPHLPQSSTTSHPVSSPALEPSPTAEPVNGSVSNESYGRWSSSVAAAETQEHIPPPTQPVLAAAAHLSTAEPERPIIAPSPGAKTIETAPNASPQLAASLAEAPGVPVPPSRASADGHPASTVEKDTKGAKQSGTEQASNGNAAIAASTPTITTVLCDADAAPSQPVSPPLANGKVGHTNATPSVDPLSNGCSEMCQSPRKKARLDSGNCSNGHVPAHTSTPRPLPGGIRVKEEILFHDIHRSTRRSSEPAPGSRIGSSGSRNNRGINRSCAWCQYSRAAPHPDTCHLRCREHCHPFYCASDATNCIVPNAEDRARHGAFVCALPMQL